MSQGTSGFYYYFDEFLSLNRDSYRVHFSFVQNSGTIIPNEAPDYPQFTGALSSVGSFYSVSGSGFFTGQRIRVAEQSGIQNDSWTHLFVLEKTGAGKGVLVDTSKSGNGIYSGYVIGLNDNNKLYFEGYNENGPFTITSKTILAKKNYVGVVKSNNNLTFYAYDWNNQTVLSDSFPILGGFIAPSNKLTLFSPNLEFPFAENGNFKGYIDEYVYLHEPLSAYGFRYLGSGFASNYNLQSGAVTSSTGVTVTGYASVFTGVTGITGYQNVIVSSGLDPFGTGNYLYNYGTVGLTGYLSSGLSVQPLTGQVITYITGDPTSTITPNSGYVSGFFYDKITYLRNISGEDISALYHSMSMGGGYNKEAGFDDVQGAFQLDRKYTAETVQVYLNGLNQVDTGYAVTGNYYVSGQNPSGDFYVDGYYIYSPAFYDRADTLIYDLISGAKKRQFLSSLPSGYTSSFLFDSVVFLNGQLLISGLDYASGEMLTDKYNGVSGYLSVFPSEQTTVFDTGAFVGYGHRIYSKNSLLFLNGQRQQLNSDYVENSTIDLLRDSGLFRDNLENIYLNSNNYWE